MGGIPNARIARNMGLPLILVSITSKEMNRARTLEILEGKEVVVDREISMTRIIYHNKKKIGDDKNILPRMRSRLR